MRWEEQRETGFAGRLNEEEQRKKAKPKISSHSIKALYLNFSAPAVEKDFF